MKTALSFLFVNDIIISKKGRLLYRQHLKLKTRRLFYRFIIGSIF